LGGLHDDLGTRWGDQYPIVIKFWHSKWENLSVYFKYPEPIRRVIYTTNSMEAVHRQFRKLIKTKGGFPNDNSLLKLLYLGIQNASKKWKACPTKCFGYHADSELESDSLTACHLLRRPT
jgi:transposase-like protein